LSRRPLAVLERSFSSSVHDRERSNPDPSRLEHDDGSCRERFADGGQVGKQDRDLRGWTSGCEVALEAGDFLVEQRVGRQLEW